MDKIKINLSELPERFQEELSQVEHNRIIQSGLEWLDSKKDFWLISGDVGVGKTLGALRVAIEWRERQIQDSFRLEANDLMREREYKLADLNFLYVTAKAYQMKCEKQTSYALDSLESLVDLLVFDELGAESVPNDPKFWFSNLEFLLDTRYQSRLKTIIVTNKSWNSLEEIYPARMLDRLKGNSILMQVKGDSQRGNNGANRI